MDVYGLKLVYDATMVEADRNAAFVAFLDEFSWLIDCLLSNATVRRPAHFQ